MNKELLSFIGLSALYLLLFAVAEWLYHRKHWHAEHTRKLVHVISGFLALTFPIFFHHHLWVMALCGSFLLILFASKSLQKLPSINAVERRTFGSELFPIAVYLLFLFYTKQKGSTEIFNSVYLYFQPLLLLAVCDPAAALVGRKFPYGRAKVWGQTKTLAGAFGFFVLAIATTILIWTVAGNGKINMAYLFICALTTTTIEFISSKGLDNFTIVLSAAICNFVFLI